MGDGRNMNTQKEEDWEAGEDAPKMRPSAPSFVPKTAPAAPIGLKPQKAVEEEDDDWWGVRRPVSNRQLWDEANRAGPTIVAPSPAHGSMPVNQIKILRRDPAPSQKRSPGPATNQKSIEERAEEYRLARERIFGQSDPSPKESEKGAKGSPRGVGDFAFVPTQVKRSPAGSREGTPTVRERSGQGHGRSPAGIVRQPQGPREGGGFGRPGG